jgi:predicted MFS family arabinose efflux permease
MFSKMDRLSLMLGNFVTGIAIMGLAGMLEDLARDLDMTIPQVGLLVTYGAIVLGVGAPLMVWATSRFDRRLLLSGTLIVVALGHLASAAAPDYTALVVLRLVMMAFAALFTPVAASTAALIVPAAERSRAIVFVFLGFSLAMAAGLPVVTVLAAHAGWRVTFAAIGVACAASGLFLLYALPRGVRGETLSLRSWTALARRRLVLLLLLLTVVQVSGQFVIFTYLAPLLTRLADADVATIGLFFSLFGIMGFIGNVIASRLVTTLKPFGTSLLALGSILAGFTLWSVGAGMLPAMGIGVGLWGLGLAAINSMQQARLVAAAPDLASAAVALNTSSIYTGQAIGSACGGFLFAHGWPQALGFTAMGFLAASLVVLALTRGRA